MFFSSMGQKFWRAIKNGRNIGDNREIIKKSPIFIFEFQWLLIFHLHAEIINLDFII